MHAFYFRDANNSSTQLFSYANHSLWLDIQIFFPLVASAPCGENEIKENKSALSVSFLESNFGENIPIRITCKFVKQE